MQHTLIFSILLLFLNAGHNPLHWFYNLLMGHSLESAQENIYWGDGDTFTREVNTGGGDIAGKIKNRVLDVLLFKCWD